MIAAHVCRGICIACASSPGPLLPGVEPCPHRCKISDGHPMLTCEQYEALRGVQDVLRCPQCGVHVVKSDGEHILDAYGELSLPLLCHSSCIGQAYLTLFPLIISHVIPSYNLPGTFLSGGVEVATRSHAFVSPPSAGGRCSSKGTCAKSKRSADSTRRTHLERPWKFSDEAHPEASTTKQNTRR